jgi:hypothetical protein
MINEAGRVTEEVIMLTSFLGAEKTSCLVFVGEGE